MSKTSSIWDKVNAAKPQQKEDVTKELTEEIKQFREKQKEFQATNDHQFYFTVVFSTKEDKDKFMQECQLMSSETIIDGYQLARKLGKEPQKPKFRLKPPF